MSQENYEILKDPAELLRETKEAFTIQDDINALIVINEKLKSIKQKSGELLDNKSDKVTKLSGKLSSLNKKIDDLNIQLSQTQEESKNFEKNDRMEDFEKELQALEAENNELKTTIDDKISHFVEQSQGSSSPLTSSLPTSQMDKEIDEEERELLKDPNVRANILKLKLFRSLGVILDSANKQVFIEGNDNKIDVLSLDEDYSDYFKTKYIWDKIGKSKN